MLKPALAAVVWRLWVRLSFMYKVAC